MLMIRLSRVGKKKYPVYRIVVQDRRKDPWGKSNEIIGTYNPHTKEFACKEDRIKYWLSVGAQMSASINNLLIRKGIVSGKKMKSAIHKKRNGEAEATEAKSEAPKSEDKKEEKPSEAPAEETKPEEKKDEKPAEEAKEEPKAEESKEEAK